MSNSNNSRLSLLSVTELKFLVSQRGVDFYVCLKKCNLVEHLEESCNWAPSEKKSRWCRVELEWDFANVTVVGIEPKKNLVGQTVLAIGNPFGLDYTLTMGVVSALGCDIDGASGHPIRGCIQIDT
eukprot:11054098-Ditylum_brightwellii.AAC.1